MALDEWLVWFTRNSHTIVTVLVAIWILIWIIEHYDSVTLIED